MYKSKNSGEGGTERENIVYDNMIRLLNILYTNRTKQQWTVKFCHECCVFRIFNYNTLRTISKNGLKLHSLHTQNNNNS